MICGLHLGKAEKLCTVTRMQGCVEKTSDKYYGKGQVSLKFLFHLLVAILIPLFFIEYLSCIHLCSKFGASSG